MSLGDFKFIYWWEWTHRLLGRLIGVAFAIPFLAFWATGRLRPGLPLKLVGVLALGALQGFIGWYMVKSGLVDRIDVSQYRLALHLLIALSILSLLVWLALDAGPAPQRVRLQTVTRAERRFAAILFGLIFLQAGLGALVAGLKAGHTYNTWPLMDGRFVPAGLGQLAPWYLNVFENVTTVQFDHRMVAYLVVLCLPDDAARAAVALAAELGDDAPKILDASTAHRVAPGWAYGFPELDSHQADTIRKAKHVANPGCYPTGAIALIRPLIDAKLLDPDATPHHQRGERLLGRRPQHDRGLRGRHRAVVRAVRAFARAQAYSRAASLFGTYAEADLHPLRRQLSPRHAR